MEGGRRGRGEGGRPTGGALELAPTAPLVPRSRARSASPRRARSGSRPRPRARLRSGWGWLVVARRRVDARAAASSRHMQCRAVSPTHAARLCGGIGGDEWAAQVK